jgi:hypothetical protein
MMATDNKAQRKVSTCSFYFWQSVLFTSEDVLLLVQTQTNVTLIADKIIIISYCIFTITQEIILDSIDKGDQVSCFHLI